MTKVNDVKEAFDYFGPQICQDKVRSFLTPGYRVMRADVKNFVKFKPTTIVLHEYDALDVNAKEFTRHFDNMDVKINVLEEAGMEVVVTTNFPEMSYTTTKSEYVYQGIKIFIHSFKSRIVYNHGSKVAALIVIGKDANGLAKDLVNVYADDLLVNQIIDHNGDGTMAKELRKSSLNKKRAFELIEKLNNLAFVHHIVDL